MIWETWVQPQVVSYQRLQKLYLISPCLTLSNIRYVSRVKWSNPGKGLAPLLRLGVVSIEKGSFRSPSTRVAKFTLLLYIYICIRFDKSLELYKSLLVYPPTDISWSVFNLFVKFWYFSSTRFFFLFFSFLMACQLLCVIWRMLLHLQVKVDLGVMAAKERNCAH